MQDLRVVEIRGKGRGVIAGKHFASGELVEAAPVLIFPTNELDALVKTTVGSYWFRWSKDNRALALGYGSLYNHSFTPNVFCIPSFSTNQIIYRALRPILPGEEITFNYNGKVEPGRAMPFSVN